MSPHNSHTKDAKEWVGSSNGCWLTFIMEAWQDLSPKEFTGHPVRWLSQHKTFGRRKM